MNMEQDGHTALHFAVEQGHEAVIQMLVAAGSRHDLSRQRLVRAACKGFAMREGDGFPP